MTEPNDPMVPPPVPPPVSTMFSAKLKGPNPVTIGAVLVAAVTIIVVGAAAVAGASPSPSSAGASLAASGAARQPATRDGKGPWKIFGGGPSGFGFGFGGPGQDGLGKRGLGGFRDGFGQITITAIDGSKISLKTVDGWTRTITVASGTTITKGGQTIAVGDLTVGDQVALRQMRNADGTFSVTAIAVVVPQVGGSVTAVSGTGFTLKARDGTTWTVNVSGSTSYTLGSTTGARTDVKVGVDVVVQGTQASGNTLTALSVHIRVPVVFGQVTAKTADTITIKRPDGTTATIHVGSSTTYQPPKSATAGLADVTVGNFVSVEGTQRADGSIDARVVVTGPGRVRPFVPNASPPGA
jgi:hypothetical protein